MSSKELWSSAPLLYSTLWIRLKSNLHISCSVLNPTQLISSDTANIWETHKWMVYLLCSFKNKTSIWGYSDGTTVLAHWALFLWLRQRAQSRLQFLLSPWPALSCTPQHGHHEVAEPSTQANLLEPVGMSTLHCYTDISRDGILSSIFPCLDRGVGPGAAHVAVQAHLSTSMSRTIVCMAAAHQHLEACGERKQPSCTGLCDVHAKQTSYIIILAPVLEHIGIYCS